MLITTLEVAPPRYRCCNPPLATVPCRQLVRWLPSDFVAYCRVPARDHHSLPSQRPIFVLRLRSSRSHSYVVAEGRFHSSANPVYRRFAVTISWFLRPSPSVGQRPLLWEGAFIVSHIVAYHQGYIYRQGRDSRSKKKQPSSAYEPATATFNPDLVASHQLGYTKGWRHYSFLMFSKEVMKYWEHAWSGGKVQDSWSQDHQNVVSSSPATASVFVSLGKILNLNLLRWPERIWYLSIVGNITI